jgi:multidrug efflux pump
MGPSTPFIRRPIATTLLTFGLAAAGAVAFFKLPVSPLPQVDFPTISVQATLPGGSPQDVATTVASPLERHLGQIADVTEMTSSSTVGAVRITLQFGLNRDINGAARDVQAAINAARADLPTSLRSNPTYRKVNPADAPILILTLTSDTMTRGDLYDAASTVLAQKLSQVEGIGEVVVGGSSLPAVRVELIPQALYKYGVGLEDVRAALASANAHSPKGGIDVDDQRYQIYANDQANKADDYKSLIVAYRNGAAVHVSDVGEVTDSVENLRNAGLANGKPAVLIILYRQPGANIISTVDLVKGLMPQLRASISPAIDIGLAVDRSTTIRTSLRDVERTLILAVLLVIVVVFAFLRNLRATLIPVVAVSVSLIATFAAMYLMGYSLDNLSLMALTVATGFVVDDAIVVLENITRYIENGLSPLEAALKGANEVGFTVLSMSISLIAVFIPILLMGGIVGRLFREFAMTISISIMISLAISLATTPMMCAVLLRNDSERGTWTALSRQRAFLRCHAERLSADPDRRASASGIDDVDFRRGAGPQLLPVRRHPEGLFPAAGYRTAGRFDPGGSEHFISADAAEADAVRHHHQEAIPRSKPWSGSPAAAKPIPASFSSRCAARRASYLRGRRHCAAAARDGGCSGSNPVPAGSAGHPRRRPRQQRAISIHAAGPTLEELNEWSPKIAAALQTDPNLTDVNSDQQNKGLESDLVIDRDAAAQLGITVSQIDNTLYDAFGQRQVSTIYVARNQYHVIMEVAPQYWQNPETLKDVYVSTSGGSVGGSQATNAVAGTVVATGTSASANSANAQAARNLATNSIGATGKGVASTGSAVSTNQETMIPLSAVARFTQGATPLAVNHQGLLVATTISFNLPANVSLSTAVTSIEAAMNRIGVPATIRGTFQGTAKAFQDSLSNQPFLILAALVTIYIVLGVLYESYVHPLTILSTLPSAGVGALLALMAFKTEFSIMALIGVILLIGIVKKNAIMMIDFALDAERRRGLSPLDAIYEACLLRFRPIMMTTMAALLGALPLAIGLGDGGELRQPLGIAIVGGLILSQILTLYSTPVIYLYMDRFRSWGQRLRDGGTAPLAPDTTLQPGE